MRDRRRNPHRREDRKGQYGGEDRRGKKVCTVASPGRPASAVPASASASRSFLPSFAFFLFYPFSLY